MEVSQIKGKYMTDKLMYHSGERKTDFLLSRFESRLSEVEGGEGARLECNKGGKKVSEFDRVAAEVDRLQVRMKEIMDEIMGDDGIMDLRNSFLLQIEVGRIANYIETTSKIIEQAVSSLKSVLQQQL